MRTLPGLATIFGGIIGVAGALSVVAVGCGGDDTAVPVDSGGTDGTTADGKTDAPAVDTGTDAIGQDAADGGGGRDTGTDTGITDAGLPTVEQFPMAVTAALCERLRGCCQVQPSSWDTAKCISGQNQAGGVKNLYFHAAALADGGAAKVQYDTAQAETCLAYVGGATCHNLSSADYTAIRTACYAALVGTIPLNGTGCTDAIECAAGRCADAGDGGGVCTNFVADGGVCASSDDCSYRGAYQPTMFCNDDSANPADDAGNPIPICQPQAGAGGNCGASAGIIGDIEGWCLSGICAGAGVCSAAVDISPPGVCTAYTIPDAGIQDAATDG